MGRPVHPKDNQPLDFDKTYPCPSCRHGSLIPITLTEAWGCDHCEQIFERREDPNTIGKLSTPYHRQRIWRWDGKRWVVGSKLTKPKVTDSVVAAALVGGLLWFGLSKLALTGFLAFGIATLVLLLVLMFWMLRRH